MAKIKVIHHTNVGITGTIRRNLQRTTNSYKHFQLHMEKKFLYYKNEFQTKHSIAHGEKTSCNDLFLL
ncbi:hypothetical protein T09_5912 [Trichinella sp. T9]|nr:hypothetical protein T09_5912 [Trichinella sp. T9]